MNIITRLKELEAAATPGPWSWEYEGDQGSNIIETREGYAVITRDAGYYGPNIPTGDLIIEMRNALPKLLAMVEAAQEVLVTTTMIQKGGGLAFAVNGEKFTEMELALHALAALEQE